MALVEEPTQIKGVGSERSRDQRRINSYDLINPSIMTDDFFRIYSFEILLNTMGFSPRF